VGAVSRIGESWVRGLIAAETSLGSSAVRDVSPMCDAHILPPLKGVDGYCPRSVRGVYIVRGSLQ